MKAAIVLTKTLGDIVILNTLCNEVKERWTESEIDVFVNQEYREIVENNPNIKNVLCMTTWDLILYKVSTEGYDKVMIPAQTTREDNIWHQIEKHRHQHLVDFYAKRCGLGEIKNRRLYMYPGNKWRHEPDNKTVAFHTTTLVKAKNWTGMSELASRIGKEGYSISQVGMLGDSELSAEKKDLRGTMTINEMANYLSKCRAFVGLDSGTSYIAAAMGIPTFCVMGATIPKTSGPFGDNVTYLLSDTVPECIVLRCHSECRFNKPCIEMMKTETAFSSIMAVLGNGIRKVSEETVESPICNA
mgnify:CR=1 FL=1